MTDTRTDVLRAAIYGRLSTVRPGEKVLSTENQVIDGADLAKRNGWNVVASFVDSGRSGWSKVEREEFDRLIKAIRAKQFDVLICWKFDRLTRNLRDYARLYEALKEAGVFLVGVADGLDTRQGWLLADVYFAVARQESENNSVRTKRMRQRLEAEGRSVGGTRAFGYQTDGSPHPVEAPILQGLFEQFAAGKGLTALCRQLNKDGVPTTKGKPWQATTMRNVLSNRRYLGLVVNKAQGRESPGRHAALVSDDVFERAQRILNAPDRKTVRVVRRHYLTGFLTCAHCGHTFGSGWAHGRPAYRCGKQSADRRPGLHTACRGPVIRCDQIDPYVEGAVLEALARPSTRQAIEARLGEGDQTRAAALAEIAELRTQLQETHFERIHPDPELRMDAESYAAVVRELNRRLAAAQARIVTHPPAAVVGGLPRDADALARHWDEHRDDPEYLRRVTACVFAEIRVGRATPGGPHRGFDESRVTLIPHS